MDSKTRFETALMEYLSYLYAAHPIFSTSMGVHEYDSEMPHVHPHILREHMDRSRLFLHELDKISLVRLPREMRFDYRLARSEAQMRTILFEQGLVYEKDPGYAVQFAMEGLYLIMKRDFQPLEMRYHHLHQRLKGLPMLLSEAKVTLINPLRIHVNHALDCISGAMSFLKDTLSEWSVQITDITLKKAILEEVGHGLSALAAYRAYIKSALYSCANDDAGIGEEWYDFQLRVGHMIEDTGNSLLEKADEWQSIELGELKESAIDIDGTSDWRHHLHMMQERVLPYDQLLDAYKVEMNRVREYVRLRKLNGETTEHIEIEATPQYAAGICNAVRYLPSPPFDQTRCGILWISPYRANAEGSMDYTQSIYDVALNVFNRTYPGIHLQTVRSQDHLNRFRAHFARSVLFEEGWGAYCEEWMRELEYYTDPHLDLLRHYRRFTAVVVMRMDILLHLRRITVEDAIHMLQEELGVSAYVATQCVHISAREPGRLICRAVGYHEMMDLRNMIMSRLGTVFEERTFPERIQKFGSAPPRVIGEEILRTWRS